MRQLLFGCGLEPVDRISHGHARCRYCAYGGRVQLVEVGQGTWLTDHFDTDEAPQRDGFTVSRPHVVTLDGFRVHAVLALNLRDHLVGAAIQVDTVDVTVRHHGAHGNTYVLHCDAVGTRLVLVDLDLHGGGVVVQIEIRIDELAVGLGGRQHFTGDQEQAFEALRRRDDELDRQTARRTWQFRELEGGDGHAGDVFHQIGNPVQYLFLARFTLAPGHHGGDTKGLVGIEHTGEDLGVGDFRLLIQDLVHVRHGVFDVVQVGVGRCRTQHGHHPLIL